MFSAAEQEKRRESVKQIRREILTFSDQSERFISKQSNACRYVHNFIICSAFLFSECVDHKLVSCDRRSKIGPRFVEKLSYD